MASWALSDLPIIDRELKPLPKPYLTSINFTKEQYSANIPPRKEAALVIGFYWKKPWTDKELAKKVKNVSRRKHEVWQKNRSLILKALKIGKGKRKALGVRSKT